MKHETKSKELPERLLYSINTTAYLLDVSRRSVEYLLARGELPFRRIGKRRLIPASAVRALARRDTPSPSPPRKRETTAGLHP